MGPAVVGGGDVSVGCAVDGGEVWVRCVVGGGDVSVGCAVDDAPVDAAPGVWPDKVRSVLQLARSSPTSPTPTIALSRKVRFSIRRLQPQFQHRGVPCEWFLVFFIAETPRSRSSSATYTGSGSHKFRPSGRGLPLDPPCSRHPHIVIRSLVTRSMGNPAAHSESPFVAETVEPTLGCNDLRYERLETSPYLVWVTWLKASSSSIVDRTRGSTPAKSISRARPSEKTTRSWRARGA